MPRYEGKLCDLLRAFRQARNSERETDDYTLLLPKYDILEETKPQKTRLKHPAILRLNKRTLQRLYQYLLLVHQLV